jgi:AAA15 family ATPase/GTPase
MSELLLDSLEIKGYRCFEHLTIEKLGRVNLIVGKNNVGKTALLEALSIYAYCRDWNDVYDILHEILRNRKEIEKIESNTLRFSEYRHLFYNRPYSERHETISELIIIGEAKIVSVAFDYCIALKSKSLDSEETYESFVEKKISPMPKHSKVFPFGIHYFNKNAFGMIEPPTYLIKDKSPQSFHEKINLKFISTKGLEENVLVETWDEVVRKNNEKNVINALSIIS